MTRTMLFVLAALMPSPAAAAAAAAEGVELPAVPKAGSVSLEEALAHRRSVREFAPAALTLAELAQLAWAAQGVAAPGHRTAPSAGATYPLEIYVAGGKVENLAAGVYRYVPDRHRLEAVTSGDVRMQLADAAVSQRWVGEAPVVVVIAAAFDRTTARYAERGRRYVQMEAGHAAQNLLLEATALGLGATPVGAFDDAQVSRVLYLPAGQKPLYLIPVGRPARP